MGLRLWEPCDDPNGSGCAIFEDPATLHLAETRWYPSSLRVFDGSLVIYCFSARLSSLMNLLKMVVGGMHIATAFANTNPTNNIEFFPPKDGGVPRPMDFLVRTLPANLFPRWVTPSFYFCLTTHFQWVRVIALPDGRIFMAANNQTAIYDMETNTETRLPDIPNGVRISYPYDGTIALLPLHPPDYTPEILICGGSATSDQIPAINLTSQDPASDQCNRMTLTPEGIQRGWEIERLLEPRVMPEMILMPNGQVIIVNGGKTGYAAFGSLKDTVVGNVSNADNPA